MAKTIKLSMMIGILLLAFHLKAQEKTRTYFQGFQKEIQGKRFSYHSPLPNVSASLLVRGEADYKAIAWETEAIPKNYQEEYVHFIMAFARDVTGKPVQFHLSVNGERMFSFQSDKTPKTGIQTFEGKDGAELNLNITMLDKYEDQMGFMSLKIPSSSLKKGMPARIKIEAEPDENPAWFMLFKTAIEESIEIKQNQVVLRGGQTSMFSVSIDFIHIGRQEEAVIQIGDQMKHTKIQFGFNRVNMSIPKVIKPQPITALIQIGDKAPLEKTFLLTPVKEWEIYLVQHTHTDIGYTRPQPEILSEHLRYIDHALDYCDLTDDYPDESKFRWTCETSWSVREYLKSRPQAQIDRLLKRLQEGIKNNLQ